MGTIPTCLLIAWLFNNSEGSLVLPCIFHGTTNVFNAAFPTPLVRAVGLRPLAVSAGVSTIAALIVVWVFGHRRLRRAEDSVTSAAFRLSEA